MFDFSFCSTHTDGNDIKPDISPPVGFVDKLIRRFFDAFYFFRRDKRLRITVGKIGSGFYFDKQNPVVFSSDQVNLGPPSPIILVNDFITFSLQDLSRQCFAFLA